ncbi:MAG: ABC-type multidrug transport system fused ATPase/permease subunit [Verrucomicrobiales bacterium]|nr:ABC-type multidrug transport system fused ATPase/permease subunit [Verrucomicrobiales bacterium]
MNKIKAVFSFGWPYLSRYWQRLVLGVLLGLIFGLANGSFVWATKTTFSRLAPPDKTVSAETQSGAKSEVASAVKTKLKEVGAAVDKFVDPWLPRIGTKLTTRQMIGGLLLLPLLVAIRGAASYLSTYCLSWVSERAINDLRVDILAKLNTLSLDFYHRSKTGDLLQRVNTDTIALQQALSLGFSDLVKEPITIVFLVTSLLVLSVKLTCFALIFMPLCIIPIIVLGRKVRRASKASSIPYITQLSLLVEAFSGVRVIKAFALEKRQLARFRETCRQLTNHGLSGMKAKALVNPMIEVIALAGLGGMIVYIVASNTALSEMMGFLVGTAMLFEPIKKLANAHVTFEQTSVGVERLMVLLAEKPSIVEAQFPKPLPQFKGGIVFENVTFSYGDKPALHGVSVNIPRGCKLGVAGESGSGKSTMINLLMRFYDPITGSIKIDGIDLKEISFTDLRNSMALVSQDNILFDQTVAENIGCGKMDATREEIVEAAKAASAHEFIMRLPQGYDTKIGERGQTLSGGQRQRLAIARAFIRNAPILVLDEATASLDSHAEMEVQAAIDRLEKNKTVICVAHRLSTLMDMDQIIVLKDGRVVEQGTFDDLIRANGAFAGMASKQGIHAQMQNVA